jgi:transcriptional regulator with XRE-family HTH domain
MEPLSLEIGKVLRRTREARGYTLRQVATVSRGRFKATSVAGYERGERSITVERFCALCRFYGVAADRILADIVRAAEGREEAEIDPRILESLGSEEGALVSGFVKQVRALRAEPEGDTIVLRYGDLEVLATAAGKRPEDLADLLRPSPAEQD